MGRCLLWIDGHGEAQLAPHEAELRLVLRVANAGDGVGHAQLFRHQAGQNIDLVTGGGGDQQIRLAYLRLLLDLIAGSVAADAHNVIDIDNVFYELGFLIDDRDPVLPDKLGGQAGAYLTRAHNNDPHSAPFRRIAPSHWFHMILSRLRRQNKPF